MAFIITGSGGSNPNYTWYTGLRKIEFSKLPVPVGIKRTQKIAANNANCEKLMSKILNVQLNN